VSVKELPETQLIALITIMIWQAYTGIKATHVPISNVAHEEVLASFQNEIGRHIRKTAYRLCQLVHQKLSV
jgi:hypothetical protein